MRRVRDLGLTQPGLALPTQLAPQNMSHSHTCTPYAHAQYSTVQYRITATFSSHLPSKQMLSLVKLKQQAPENSKHAKQAIGCACLLRQQTTQPPHDLASWCHKRSELGGIGIGWAPRQQLSLWHPPL
jgi:hypothetical protein